MDEVHAAVDGGTALAPVVVEWGIDEAKRIIGLVMDEYVNDFNRALQQGSHELDVTTFTRKYDALWGAKLDLDRGRYAASYKDRFESKG